VKTAAVLGWPVAHSKSPVIHDAAFAALGIDAKMIAIAVPPERLAAAVADLVARGALGASITLPHKQAVVASCDSLASSAAPVGIVNCLAFEGARVVGHNTDSIGFHDGLVAAGFAPHGKRVVVLGAGGAARAVHAAFARDVVVIARRPETVAWIATRPWTDAELRSAFAAADLVVDCTSAGLDPATDRALADALPLDALPPAAWIATLVYHRTTQLLERARAAGRRTVDGRGMLVHQAAHAFALWTGCEPPLAIMERALDDALVKSA
jgi:shikimate dehydrogenase